MSKFTPGSKIGYLGGGQLARMLAESAIHFGCLPHILCEKKDDPAAQASAFVTPAKINDLKTLIQFLGQVDVATFESEFMDAPLLVEAQKQSKTKIFPAPALMGMLQDRRSQKELLARFGIPTSPWICIDLAADAVEFANHQKFPLVFKKRFFGYDGYGTFIIKNKKQLADFLKKDFKSGLFIAEKFIPFKKEYAVILARSTDESFTHLPLVESYQKEARCDWVKGPVKISGSDEMMVKLKRFLVGLKYVGVMGVEFFHTHRGLMVNEIAPRVHNTGHYSLDTDGPSQFDLHNMCLLGQKLPKKISIKKGFAMANLIGSGKKVRLKNNHGHLYWYGKKENRKGRKMGHINALGSSPDEALKLALKRRREIDL